MMKNKDNKRELAQLLCTYDLGYNIHLVSRAKSIAQHDEADITLISYMLHAAERGARTICILSDDTDVFVLLVYWCWKCSVKSRVQMLKWDGVVLNINATVSKLGDKCSGILGMHALSGCDTVSYPNGKGKVSALKVLTQTNIIGLDSILGEVDASETDLIKTGTEFFLALYCQPKSSSMNAARYDIFRRRKTPPSLKSLPPTDMNLKLHIKRAHLQMMLWKAADKIDPPNMEITDYGWDVTDRFDVMPLIDKQPVAPELLMDVISCGCKAKGKACSGKCSCASNGLACTSYCVCEGGDGCFNILTQQADEDVGLAEDYDYEDDD